MPFYLYKNDIPSEINFGDIVAIDTETMGLNLQRDRLCLIQLSNGDGNAHLVQISKKSFEGKNSFVNLKNICPINGQIYCTKIASQLSRTFGAKHGLSDLCRDLLDIELDKYNQTSDWGAPILNESQLQYAASDVIYLHRLKK